MLIESPRKSSVQTILMITTVAATMTTLPLLPERVPPIPRVDVKRQRTPAVEMMPTTVLGLTMRIRRAVINMVEEGKRTKRRRRKRCKSRMRRGEKIRTTKRSALLQPVTAAAGASQTRPLPRKL